MIWPYFLLVSIILIFGMVVFRGAPYVPSLKFHLRTAFEELYPIAKNDVLVDIGSGDGVVLREASKRGATAIGYEINPFLVMISRCLSFNDKKVSVRLADLWFTHLPDNVTVVYVFSVSRDIDKIQTLIQNESKRLGRTISVISFGFEFSDRKSLKNVGAYNLYLFQPNRN